MENSTYQCTVFLHSRQDKKGKIKVAFCLTTNMLADFFMKPLQGSTFKRMRSIILNMPITDKTSIEHRSVLENEKIMQKQKKNQDTAPMKTRSLKTRARGQNIRKQD